MTEGGGGSDLSMAELAMAAFHLGEELGVRAPAESTLEHLAELIRTLRQIAEGELTLIGGDIPHIMAHFAGELEPGTGNRAVRTEREAARLLLRGHEDALSGGDPLEG